MSGLDRKTFFDAARARAFGGALTQEQVDGCNAIIDGFEKRYPTGDPRWLAYILATAYWETDRTLQPIREIEKGRGRMYGAPDPQTGLVYYGRGYVQLTWKSNYKTLSAIVGADLVANPDLALEPDKAAAIMFAGMERGLFTGKKLAQFFAGDKTDWVNARTIINGHDHAGDIAAIAQGLFAAIQAATKAGAGKMSDQSNVQPVAPNTEAIARALTQVQQRLEEVAQTALVARGAPSPIVSLVITGVNAIGLPRMIANALGNVDFEKMIDTQVPALMRKLNVPAPFVSIVETALQHFELAPMIGNALKGVDFEGLISKGLGSLIGPHAAQLPAPNKLA